MRCPACDGLLQQTTVTGVALDRCVVCGGFWFDDGEMGECF